MSSATIGVEVLSVIKSGSSRPVVVRCADGATYLIKLSGGLSGPYANCCDYVSLQIGRALGLPIFYPEQICLDASLDTRAVDEEVRDLIQKSLGLNLAYRYLTDARDFYPAPDRPEDPLLDRLFMLDLFLLNVDRTPKNSNLLHSAGQLYSFDYESAFLIMGIFQGKNYLDSAYVARQLRQNPLFLNSLQPTDFQLFFSSLRQIDLHAITENIPESWLPPQTDSREKIHAGLIASVQNEAGFLQFWEQVQHIEPEPEEARRARTLANRLEFEAKFKKEKGR